MERFIRAMRTRVTGRGATALCVVLLAVPAFAEQEQQPQAKQYTRKDYEQAVQVVQQMVEGQKDRLRTVTDKLKATDDQIERRISRVVDFLSTVADSRESGTKVIRAKEDVLEGLKKTIDLYVRERDMRFAELSRVTTRLSKEDLVDDVNRLNNRVEKRVEQVLTITMSLPEEKEVPQILTTYAGDAVSTSINPEYSHNKMVTARARQIRKKVHDGLEASIARLSRSNNELERNIAYARTEKGGEFVRNLVQRNSELIEKRRTDILRILTDSRPAAKTLGSRAADEIVRQVQADRMEAKQDFNEWNRLKSDRDNERLRLRELADRLAQYEKVVDTWKD